MLDLIIKNATIVDGTGAEPFEGSIPIRDGKIRAIWHGGFPAGVEAKEIYDAKGLVVSPGFIDIHCHSDETFYKYPKEEGKILQGVTTDVGGNCGISLAPVRQKTKELLRSYVGEAPYAWGSFGEFLDYVEKEVRPSANFLCGVGHGALRIAAMGFEPRKATAAELEDMKAMLAEAFEEGAAFLSSGLIYAPGSFSDEEELMELAKVAAKYGRYYATHMRNENLRIFDALPEAIRIAENSGASLQISHHKLIRREMWGRSKETLQLIDLFLTVLADRNDPADVIRNLFQMRVKNRRRCIANLLGLFFNAQANIHVVKIIQFASWRIPLNNGNLVTGGCAASMFFGIGQLFGNR